MDILNITRADLEKGKYQEQFPELYAVKGLIESNAWHKDQDVFGHILKVFDGLKTTLARFPQYKTKLSVANDKLTREEILTLATIYHDVGKSLTLFKTDEGTTAPGHEEISAYLFLQNRNLNLSPKDQKAVALIISKHGFVNNIGFVYKARGDKEIIKIFSEISQGWALELTLFMLSDLEGSDLKNLNHEQYSKIKENLENILTLI